jgi:hypothetical protein
LSAYPLHVPSSYNSKKVGLFVIQQESVSQVFHFLRRQRIDANVLRFSVIYCVEDVDEVVTGSALDARVHCFVASVAVEDLCCAIGFQFGLVTAEDYDLADAG